MSSVAVNPPKTPVTKGSNGVAAATLPNVCKMPGPPAPFVPTPLPNIGKSDNSPSGYSTSVTIEGHAVAIRGATFNSVGDVASQGTGGGLISSTTQGATQFIAPGSMDVKIEGKNVQLLGDAMLNNCSNPGNAGTTPGEVQGALPTAVVKALLCSLFCECLAEAPARKFELSSEDLDAIHPPDFAGPPPGKSAYQKCVERKFNSNYKKTAPNIKAEQSFETTFGTRRPDFVVDGRPTKVFEMKFPGDQWREGQKEAYTEIGGGRPPTELNKKTCKC